jgi:hypothetical protein
MDFGAQERLSVRKEPGQNSFGELPHRPMNMPLHGG